MKPLRRKLNRQVTIDPVTGQQRVLALDEGETILSDEKSVDSLDTRYTCFLDCGCDGPVGGRCYECGAISCKNCYGRCHSCGRPLCLACSRYLTSDSGERLRLCKHCHESLSRKRFWSGITQAIKGLFVEEVSRER